MGELNDSRHPVNILQEYLIKYREHPYFDFIGEVNENPLSTKMVFKYSLTLFDGKYTASGTGLNKSYAKTETAKQMLMKLAEDREDLRQLLETHSFDPSLETIPSSNSIADLLNICLQYNLKEPIYEIKTRGGLSEAPRITYSCKVSRFITEATSSSKKNAKYKVSQIMLEKLKKELGNLQTEKSNVAVPKAIFDPREKERVIQELKSRTLRTFKDYNIKLAKTHLVYTDPETRIVMFMNELKSKRNMDHDQFCRFLDLASLEEVELIIELLRNNESVEIGATFIQAEAGDVFTSNTKYFCFCRMYAQGMTHSFSTFGYDKNMMKKAAYLLLLKYLSDIKLNTSGVSYMLDDNTSGEE